jgi:hypothetical protein
LVQIGGKEEKRKEGERKRRGEVRTKRYGSRTRKVDGLIEMTKQS